MLEAVEVVVQGQGVAQVHADGAVDGLGGGTALVHQLLDLLELLSRGEVGGQADAGGGSQLDDGVLGEVFTPQPMSPDHSSSMALGDTSTGAKASSLSQPVIQPSEST